MGRGKQIICCCESSCWCCTIEIIYLILGIIHIINGTSAMGTCSSETSGNGGYLCASGKYSVGTGLNELVSGAIDLVLCGLIYCGVKNRNRGMLNIYIAIQVIKIILIMIMPFIAFIILIIATNESGNTIPTEDITKAVVVILIAILINMLWPLFCLYCVSVHKNEVCNGNAGYNQYANTGYAHPSTHTGVNADSVPMADPTPSLGGAEPGTKNADSTA